MNELPQVMVDRFLRNDYSITFKLSALERILLVMLASFTGNKTDCWPSQVKLSRVCGTSIDSVKRNLKSLENKHLVKIIRSIGASNHYELTIPSADSTRCSQHLGANSATYPVPSAYIPSADSPPNNISNNINEYTSEVSVNITNSLIHKNESIPDCPHEAIIDLYHEILPMCPKVKRWTKKRKDYLEQRWRESPECQSLSYWRQYFEHISQSKWLTGEIPGSEGKRSFLADLEWLIEPTRYANVLEGGRYHRE